MHKEILISVEPQEKRVAIVACPGEPALARNLSRPGTSRQAREGGQLEEFYVERGVEQRIVGNIYKGKVQSVTSGIGAAFVEFGMPKSGFLYVSDVVGISPELEETVELVSRKKYKPEIKRIDDTVKKDQEIMIQVTKEPFGTKGARLTTKISLPGRYLVLMPIDSHLGISKRIESSKERDRLRQILETLHLPQEMGVIVRTAGQGRSKNDFIRDLRFLLKLWKNIKTRFARSGPSTLLHQEHGLIFRVLRDLFTEDVNKLVIDSKQEYREIMHYVSQLMPHMRQRVEFYRDMEPLFEKKHIESQIEKVYDRKVLLKGGGYLIIEQTESLVAIDVNSGKYIGKKDVEDTVFAVNVEAAKEVAKQIKLRDLGGIIVIDFIDMKTADHRKKIFHLLEEEVKKDKAKTNVLHISELGLIQMTRQRSRKPVESLVYQVCPYCHGKGATKSVKTMAIYAIRKMKVFLSANRGVRKIYVEVHPDVASRLFNEDRRSIDYLQKYYRVNITVKPEPTLHIENIKIDKVV